MRFFANLQRAAQVPDVFQHRGEEHRVPGEGRAELLFSPPEHGSEPPPNKKQRTFKDLRVILIKVPGNIYIYIYISGNT